MACMPHLLRLEQGVKVPETALYVVVGGHLLESHLGEDLAELSAHLSRQIQGLGNCYACAEEMVLNPIFGTFDIRFSY